MFKLWARDITSQDNDSGKYMNEPWQGDKSTVIMVKSVKNLRELRLKKIMTSVKGRGTWRICQVDKGGMEF